MARRAVSIILASLLALSALLPVVGCADDAVDVEVDTTAESTAVGSADDPDSLLTPADVEAVSGLTGLEVVPYDPAVGAGGDVNIATADGQLVAMLVVEGPETWDAWLTDGYTVSGPVTPPVGDEAFIGPNPDVSSATYIFGFRKGETAIVIDTFFDPTGETVLSAEQLRELALLIENRL